MTATDAPMTPINLAVGGMTCAGCASSIQRGLSQLDGVSDAVVNVATRRATVRPDGTVDPEDLDLMMRAAITGLGYHVLTAPREEAGAAGLAGPVTGDAVAHHRSTPPGDSSHDGHGDQRGHDGQGRHGDQAQRTQEPARHGHMDPDLPSEHAAHMHADASRIADLRRRFLVAAALSIPLLALSMVPAWQFRGWEWIAAALATPVIVWAGWPFHRSTVMSARHGAVNMDTLVTIGTLAAWTWSTVVLVGGALGVDVFAQGHVYYETGSVIVTLILLGKWLEVRSTARAGDAVRALSARQSATARLEDGTEVAREALAVGMRFVTRPGEVVATDGIVVDGAAAVDASLVTGESVPVAAHVGDEVIGGTIATDGALTIEATRVGRETMLAQIARMVDEAQSGRARIQRLADRIASIFVPIVIALSVVTLGAWLLATGDPNRAFTAAVAVLIISCPCALGLATPLAIMVGTGRGAQLGTLVRGPEALEDTRDVHIVVLDKTGTVTEGRMSVASAWAPSVPDSGVLFDAVAAVEARSEHPIAHAIADSRDSHALVKGFRSIPGQGAVAVVQGAAVDGEDAEVTVGSRRLFDEISPDLEERATRAERAGRTVVFAGRAPQLGSASSARLGGPMTVGAATLGVRTALVAEAMFEVADVVKPTSREAIGRLVDLGLEVMLLTGDNARVANAVAYEVGIDRVIADVLPGSKADVIADLQRGGRRVAMVGDGVNDAPALAQADLGIAIGTGADVAREASDLTIVSGDLLAVADAIALSRRTLGTIRGNLVWAFAYNVLAIPLAAFGLLNPMIASAAMGGSSLFVVGNSLRLRSFSGYRSRP